METSTSVNSTRLFEQPLNCSYPAPSRSPYAYTQGNDSNRWSQPSSSFSSHTRAAFHEPNSLPRAPVSFLGYKYTLGNEPSVLPHTCLKSSMATPKRDTSSSNGHYWRQMMNEPQNSPPVHSQTFRQGHMPHLTSVVSVPTRPAYPRTPPAQVPVSRTNSPQYSNALGEPFTISQHHSHAQCAALPTQDAYVVPSAFHSRHPISHHTHGTVSDIQALTWSYSNPKQPQNEPTHSAPRTASPAPPRGVLDPIFDPQVAYLNEQYRDTNQQSNRPQTAQAYGARVETPTPPPPQQQQQQQQLSHASQPQVRKPVEVPRSQATYHTPAPPPAHPQTPTVPHTQNDSRPTEENTHFVATANKEDILRKRAQLKKEIALGNDILAYRLREYNEAFPLATGDTSDKFYRDLLANKPLAVGDNSEAARAVNYAKSKWWHYWGQDELRLVIEKMRAEGKERPKERLMREMRAGGHLMTEADLQAIQKTVRVTAPQMEA